VNNPDATPVDVLPIKLVPEAAVAPVFAPQYDKPVLSILGSTANAEDAIHSERAIKITVFFILYFSFH
jgi:hypothetical protein